MRLLTWFAVNSCSSEAVANASPVLNLFRPTRSGSALTPWFLGPPSLIDPLSLCVVRPQHPMHYSPSAEQMAEQCI